jgi:hypothetical protein
MLIVYLLRPCSLYPWSIFLTNSQPLAPLSLTQLRLEMLKLTYEATAASHISVHAYNSTFQKIKKC